MIALRNANKYIIEKYIGSTTTNHGADMAISRRTDIQHDGHAQAFPRYKRRQTMDGTHCMHIHATDPRYHTQNTISMYHITQCRIKVARGPWHILTAGPLRRGLATFSTSTGAR